MKGCVNFQSNLWDSLNCSICWTYFLPFIPQWHSTKTILTITNHLLFVLLSKNWRFIGFPLQVWLAFFLRVIITRTPNGNYIHKKYPNHRSLDQKCIAKNCILIEELGVTWRKNAQNFIFFARVHKRKSSALMTKEIIKRRSFCYLTLNMTKVLI